MLFIYIPVLTNNNWPPPPALKRTPVYNAGATKHQFVHRNPHHTHPPPALATPPTHQYTPLAISGIAYIYTGGL
jgi:hypothetical protein